MQYLFNRQGNSMYIKLFFIISIISIISGCSDLSTKERLDLAKSELDSKNYSKANIFLKKIIQKDPKHIQARMLLAKSYQEQGSFIFAEKEWTKANELGADVDKTLQDTLVSLYALGDDIGVIDFWNENRNKLDTSSKLSSSHIVVLSLFKLNKIDESKDLLKAVLNLKTTENKIKDKALLKVLGEVLFTEIALEKKISKLSGISKQIDIDLPTKLVLANLYFINKQFSFSAQIYEEIATSRTEFIEAMIIAVESFLRQPDMNKAEFYINHLLTGFPKHPYINQLAAQIQVQQTNFLKAQEYIEIAMLNGRSTPQLNLLAGLTHFQLDHHEQAESFLNGLQQYYPKNDFVKKLIVSNKLKLGIHADLTDILNSKDDIKLLSSISFLLLDTAPEISFNLLKKLELNDIENIAERNKMGIAKLMSNSESIAGDIITSATETLNDKTSSNEAINSSKFLLISALIKQGKLSEANNTLASWRKKSPKNITNLLLLANITNKNNQTQSIQLYHEVLTIDPSNRTSLLKLGQYHLGKEEYAEANKFFQQIVQQNKQDVQGLLGLYSTMSKIGGTTLALDKIEGILLPIEQKNENDQIIILANIYLIAQQPQKALSLLSAYTSNRETKSELTYSLIVAEANLQLKYYAKAISIYDRILIEEINLKIIRKKLLIHDISSTEHQAISDLKIFLKKHSNNINLKIIAAGYFVDNNESVLALELIKETEIPSDYQNIVQSIIAKAFYYQGKYSEALIILESQYNILKNNQLASYIYNSLLKLNRIDDASLFMTSHLLDKPEDINNRLLFADKNISRSTEQYKEILKLSPKNIMALNNLAWRLYKQNKFSEAKKYAQQALTLDPKNKNVLDTYNKINKALQ
ncbi:MAG: putative PEP-CTERM system TPR-repeat lipoprotein [Colwellia sp.]|jgi:putative PEP-CTERM system TPR-repeat lipoprotein